MGEEKVGETREEDCGGQIIGGKNEAGEKSEVQDNQHVVESPLSEQPVESQSREEQNEPAIDHITSFY